MTAFIKMYDKRENIDFPVVNFSFLNSDIPGAPSFGIS